jgi:hypothetical protein
LNRSSNLHDRIDAIQLRLNGAKATAHLMESCFRNEPVSEHDFLSAAMMVNLAIEEAQELLEKLKTVMPVEGV